MKKRMSSRTAAIAALITALALGTSGCALLDPSAELDHQIRTGLSRMVEKSQDIVWEFREELAASPEVTIPLVWGMTDARPAYIDKTFTVPPASWKLLNIAQDVDGTALTLMTSAGASTGGGLFYESRSALICFVLVIAPDLSRIDTEPSDCSDQNGHGVTDLAFAADEGKRTPLDELDVRLSVDASDYVPLPCQCHSGGDCDCPGG